MYSAINGSKTGSMIRTIDMVQCANLTVQTTAEHDQLTVKTLKNIGWMNECECIRHTVLSFSGKNCTV